MTKAGVFALSLLALAVLARPERAAARVLTVGPGEAFALAGSAALAARPGDIIRIAPGRYADCAVWTVDGITIEGAADGVVMADEICERKAIFVVAANNVTVRNITFTGAHNWVHNGAGIRAEGANLTVENSRFLDNDEGILAGSNDASTITIRRSVFAGNGNCIGACAHGLYVGQIALLRVENSEFTAQREGHHIKSRALRTELVGNRIADGPEGSSSYLVDLPAGGAILIDGNQFEKGPHSQNRRVAIAIGAEMDQAPNPAGPIEIRNNTLVNDIGGPTVFVRNDTATPAILQGNKLSGTVTPLRGSGTVD